jgi:carbamoyl-phosphate synthase small subunit
MLIERLGGAKPRGLTGVGTEAVRKWRQAGTVPSRHWAAVIAATGLALSDLAGGPATPRADRSPPG